MKFRLKWQFIRSANWCSIFFFAVQLLLFCYFVRGDNKFYHLIFCWFFLFFVLLIWSHANYSILFLFPRRKNVFSVQFFEHQALFSFRIFPGPTWWEKPNFFHFQWDIVIVSLTERHRCGQIPTQYYSNRSIRSDFSPKWFVRLFCMLCWYCFHVVFDVDGDSLIIYFVFHLVN